MHISRSAIYQLKNLYSSPPKQAALGEDLWTVLKPGLLAGGGGLLLGGLWDLLTKGKLDRKATTFGLTGLGLGAGLGGLNLAGKKFITKKISNQLDEVLNTKIEPKDTSDVIPQNTGSPLDAFSHTFVMWKSKGLAGLKEVARDRRLSDPAFQEAYQSAAKEIARDLVLVYGVVHRTVPLSVIAEVQSFQQLRRQSLSHYWKDPGQNKADLDAADRLEREIAQKLEAHSVEFSTFYREPVLLLKKLRPN